MHWNWIGFIEITALFVAVVASARIGREEGFNHGARRAYVEVSSELRRTEPEYPYDWEWERTA